MTVALHAESRSYRSVWDLYRETFPGWEMPSRRSVPGRHRAPERVPVAVRRLRGATVAVPLLLAMLAVLAALAGCVPSGAGAGSPATTGPTPVPPAAYVHGGDLRG